MNLDQLKKELKKKNPEAQKNKRRRVLLLALSFLAVCSIAIALTFAYRSYDQTAPERLFSKGLTFESQARPEQALASYERLFGKYSASVLAPEALFRAGRICRFDLRQDQKALFFFLQLEHDYPESDYVAAAQLEAAELTKYRLRDFAQAIVVYQRLLDNGPRDGDLVLYEIADCYFRLNNFSQTRIELDTLLERYPDSPLRPEALYRRANALLLDEKIKEARTGFQDLIDGFPQSSYALEAKFSLAELLEDEERLKDALNAYQKMTDYPRQELLQEKIERLNERIAKKKKAL